MRIRKQLNRVFDKNFQKKASTEIPKKEYGSSRADAFGRVKSRKDSLVLRKQFKKLPVAKYGLNNNDNGPVSNPHSQSNPKDRTPQYQLNRFIKEYVMPEYGGNIEGWKHILNEIAWHESGPHQRFDLNAKQKGGGPGRSFAQIEANSAKTNLTRLFSAATDDGGTYYHRYERLFDQIKDKNKKFTNEAGDTLTQTSFPELEKLYYSMVDVKTDDDGNIKGWTGDQDPFDIRQVSDESKGILMLLELMGQYEKTENPKIHLKDYFDQDGNLKSVEQRVELWGAYYNTDMGIGKRARFLKDASKFSKYNDSEGVITKWSWPDGYGGDPEKNSPIINYAPFYTHTNDLIDLDAITKNLKLTFEQQYGEGSLEGESFEDIIRNNKINFHEKDKMNVVGPEIKPIK